MKLSLNHISFHNDSSNDRSCEKHHTDCVKTTEQQAKAKLQVTCDMIGEA